MGKNRLEAFSDGVLAIIITIMVLEFRPPHADSLQSLKPLLPVLISYVLSFINIAIYWNNHHHMMHLVRNINGTILWANINLLFWLSLIPFVTAWIGATNFAIVPLAIYGFILFMAGIAYYILTHCLLRLHGKDSDFAAAVGKDIKGIMSFFIYLIGIPICFLNRWVGFAMYISVAAIWLIPDKRFEQKEIIKNN